VTKLPFNLIVVDVETAGRPDNRLLEIGAVRITEDLVLSDEYEMLIDARPILPDAQAIHGISDDMVKDKPKFEVSWKIWVEWCDQFRPYVLGTWSDYDSTTLRDEYKRINKRYPHPGHCLDVKSVVWWECLRRGYYSRTFPVDRALSILGIPFEGRKHRGLPDARMEAKLFQFVALNNPIPVV
jgi:DNA polymerase III epsilon subunit-like protein